MRTVSFCAAAFLISACLSGCLGLRSSANHQPMNPGFIPPPDSLAVARPLSDKGPAPLTLDDCIQIARINNPSLAAGGWDVQVALAQRDNKASERWPNIGGSARYHSYLQNQRLVPVRKNLDPGMFSTSQFAGDIILRLPLVHWRAHQE